MKEIIKVIELYMYGIDYYGISPSTIILAHDFSRLDGIMIGDLVHIHSQDGVNWTGNVVELAFNTIRLEINRNKDKI